MPKCFKINRNRLCMNFNLIRSVHRSFNIDLLYILNSTISLYHYFLRQFCNFTNYPRIIRNLLYSTYFIPPLNIWNGECFAPCLFLYQARVKIECLHVFEHRKMRRQYWRWCFFESFLEFLESTRCDTFRCYIILICILRPHVPNHVDSGAFPHSSMFCAFLRFQLELNLIWISLLVYLCLTSPSGGSTVWRLTTGFS